MWFSQTLTAHKGRQMSFTENTKDDNCRILTVIFFYLEFLFLLVFLFSFLFVVLLNVHKGLKIKSKYLWKLQYSALRLSYLKNWFFCRLKKLRNWISQDWKEQWLWKWKIMLSRPLQVIIQVQQTKAEY